MNHSPILDFIREPTGYLAIFINWGVLILIAALYFFLDSLLDRWQRLPERTRWFLCWPAMPILFFITGLSSTIFVQTILMFILRSFHFLEGAADFISLIMVGILAVPISYFIVFRLVPRKQHWVMGAWVAFCTLLLGILFVIGVLDKTLSISEGLQSFMYLSNVIIGFNYYRSRLPAGLPIKLSPFNYYLAMSCR